MAHTIAIHPEMQPRPAFLLDPETVPEELDQYPDSDEELSFGRAIGSAAGLERIGLHHMRVPPGHRLSFPHAEEDEEEFVYVLEGEIQAWIDGELYSMKAGELAAFPAGTGICHTFINNGHAEARLLVGGEASKATSRIYYPKNPEREAQVGPDRWWANVPARVMGTHDGMPRKR